MLIERASYYRNRTTYLDVCQHHGSPRKRRTIKSCPELYVGWPGSPVHQAKIDQGFCQHPLDFCILETPANSCDSVYTNQNHDYFQFPPTQRRLSQTKQFQRSLRLLPTGRIGKPNQVL